MVGCYGFKLAVRVSIFSFSDDNLSKHKWIFTKLYMCFDIVKIWVGIAYEKILSILTEVILTEVSACDSSLFSVPDDNFSNFKKLGTYIDIEEICFGIANR